MMSRSQSLTQRPWYSGVSAVNVPSGATGADQRRAFAVDKSGSLGLEQIEVNFTKGRGLVDDARAGVDGDEIGRHDAPGNVLAAACFSGPAAGPGSGSRIGRAEDSGGR